MLDEYALTPDVFDPSCYSAPNLCTVYLQVLKEPLLQEAVVRDLRMGEWREFVLGEIQKGRFDLRAKELVKKLVTQNRLRPASAQLDHVPADDRQWCEEAIQSVTAKPANGVIVSETMADRFSAQSQVCSVERLSQANWWRIAGQSQQVSRTTVAYLQTLKCLLQCARSLVFIDPHLNPSEKRYSEFVQLLLAARRTNPPQPHIEIHRVCYESSKNKGQFPAKWERRFRGGKGAAAAHDGQFPANREWERRFRTAWDARLRAAGLRARVFIWDSFHDRFLITDLMGLALTNGFDVSADPAKQVVFSRLSRKDRENCEREFSPNAHRHELWHSFDVGQPTRAHEVGNAQTI